MSESRIASRGRIARYTFIMASVTFIAYMIRLVISMLMARQSMAMAAMSEYVSLAVNLLAALITATLNRRHTFRSTLAWGLAVSVLVLLELVFDWLSGLLWRLVMEQLMTMVDPLTMGQSLQMASYAFNLTQFIVWAVLAYLFQRFVLYRNTLDAAASAPEYERM